MSLVIPFSEVHCVEKFETTGEPGISNGLLVTTKSKVSKRVLGHVSDSLNYSNIPFE